MCLFSCMSVHVCASTCTFMSVYLYAGFARYPMVGYIYKVNSVSSEEIWLWQRLPPVGDWPRYITSSSTSQLPVCSSDKSPVQRSSLNASWRGWSLVDQTGWRWPEEYQQKINPTDLQGPKHSLELRSSCCPHVLVQAWLTVLSLLQGIHSVHLTSVVQAVCLCSKLWSLTLNISSSFIVFLYTYLSKKPMCCYTECNVACAIKENVQY